MKVLNIYQCLWVPVFVCSMKVGDHKHGQNVFFHATGLSGDNNPSRGTNWKMRTLQKQREELGHSKVCIYACCPLKACSLHEMGLDVFGLFCSNHMIIWGEKVLRDDLTKQCLDSFVTYYTVLLAFFLFFPIFYTIWLV